MADKIPTLDTIHAKTKIPMRHLVKLQAMGFMPAQKPDAMAAAIRANIKKRNALPPVQYIWLIHNRESLPMDLQIYHVTIADLLADLGDVQGQGAPWEIANRIGLAAGHNPAAVAVLAQWARGVLSSLPDGQSVPYAWLACRLLINVPAYHVHGLSRAMIKAIALIRKHPAMQGAWHTIGRNVAYHKPQLDL